jgi:hypothetical protein
MPRYNIYRSYSVKDQANFVQSPVEKRKALGNV